MRTNVPFNLMIKPVGPTCNLACEYCYYLSKSEFLTGAPAVMDEPTLERVTQAYLDAHPDGEVVFNWQGGEPLIAGIDFFRRAVDLQKHFARPGQRVLNAIQTNATLVTRDWAEFFAREGFLVGVSLDGPASLHDQARRSQSGQATHALVVAGLKRLLNAGVSVNVLATVNRANASHPLEVYRHIREQGVYHIQYIPVVERSRNHSRRVTPSSVRPHGFGQFLCGVFDEWLERDLGKAFVQLFESTLNVFMGGWPTVCAQGPLCGRGLVVERGEELFACDHYVFPEFLRGTLTDAESLVAMVDGAAQRQFGEAKADVSMDCLKCEWLRMCGGDCPKHRLNFGSDGKPVSILCEGYRAFFQHAAPAFARMAQALARGQLTPQP